MIGHWQAVDELVGGSASLKDAVLEKYDYGGSDYYQPLIDSYSDMQFTCPATTTAKAHAKAGDMLYRYLVSMVTLKDQNPYVILHSINTIEYTSFL